MDERKNSVISRLAERYESIAKSLSHIGTMMEQILQAADKNKHGFTAQRFCADFDLLLQHSLLWVAASDDSASAEEIAAADRLTKFGDLVALSMHELGTEFGWQDIRHMALPDIKNWLRALRSPVRKATAQFCSAFAAIDSSGFSLNYFETFQNELAEFLSEFALMEDGEFSDAELEAMESTELASALDTIEQFIRVYHH